MRIYCTALRKFDQDDNQTISQIGTVTERGCLGSATDADGCDPAENCGTCAGSGCNTALFPADRRKCVVGSSANQYCPDPWDDCVQIASTTSGGR